MITVFPNTLAASRLDVGLSILRSQSRILVDIHCIFVDTHFILIDVLVFLFDITAFLFDVLSVNIAILVAILATVLVAILDVTGFVTSVLLLARIIEFARACCLRTVVAGANDIALNTGLLTPQYQIGV